MRNKFQNVTNSKVARFSLRKTTLGVVSALVAFGIYSAANTTAVHAQQVQNSSIQKVEDVSQVKQNSQNSINNTSETKKQEAKPANQTNSQTATDQSLNSRH